MSFPHPYPYLSMWGDFSNLRRVLIRYDDELPSDLDAREKVRSPQPCRFVQPLHTAACTLSMLAL